MTDTAIDDDTTSDPATGQRPGRAPRRTDTRNPHRSRERALKILFQADVRGVSPQVTLQRLADDASSREILDAVDDLTSDDQLLKPVIDGAEEVELVSVDRGATIDRGPAGVRAGGHRSDAGGAGDALDAFTLSLVAGVDRDRDRIDELIGRFARKWQVSRMPVVDRNALRLATYELIHETTSPAIVIDEAVGLAKAMSTDDSGRYVNGVLESIRRHLAEHPLPALEQEDLDGMAVDVGLGPEASQGAVEDADRGAEATGGPGDGAGPPGAEATGVPDDDAAPGAEATGGSGDHAGTGEALDIALELLDAPGSWDGAGIAPSADLEPADEPDVATSWSNVRERPSADQPTLFEDDTDDS